MPELPEVETVRLQLEKYLLGHRLESVVTGYRNFYGNPKEILGATFREVRRFGKVLSLDLDNGYSLVIHIKLTGQLIFRDPNLKSLGSLSKKVIGGVPGAHTLVTFKLSGGSVLYYNDVRRFGWLKIVRTGEVKSTGFVGKLGPEPHVTRGLGWNSPLTFELFSDILSKGKRPVKIILMDQEKMSGVGNIYANDALWLSGIDPKTPANKLEPQQVKKLYGAIHTVLKAGLKYGGASELAFVTPDGSEGEYQNHTLVYGHEKEVCGRCKKSVIEKYFLSGRGTYWCPLCQK